MHVELNQINRSITIIIYKSDMLKLIMHVI